MDERQALVVRTLQDAAAAHQRMAAHAGVIDEVAGAIGAALGKGRTVFAFGNGGSVEESDAAGNVTWKIDGNSGYVFRAERILSLYRPGVGDAR